MKHVLIRTAFTVAALVLGAVNAAAQKHYEPNVAVGAHTGVTLSRTNFQPTVPQSFAAGFALGGKFRYMEEKHFGLVAELNVEQRGWKEKFEGQDFNYTRRFTYLQIPIMTHLYFGGDKCHFFFNAGPSVGIMIGESTSSNFDYNHIDQIADFPVTNRYNDQLSLDVKHKFDYGITAGAGVEYIASHKHSFSLEGCFYYGLNDVFSNRKRDTFSGSGGMSIMVTLGYYYRLK